MKKLKKRRILMFVDDIYEDLELWYPKLRLLEEGIETVVAGLQKDKIYLGKHKYSCKSDAAITDVSEKDFDGLVIPGGFAPDQLRRIPKVLELTRQFHKSKKLVAHICHGGWIPISAGIMKGFKCTSTPGIKDDIINAGAKWIDAPLVVDRHMVSSRRPSDLPQFCQGILRILSK